MRPEKIGEIYITLNSIKEIVDFYLKIIKNKLKIKVLKNEKLKEIFVSSNK